MSYQEFNDVQENIQTKKKNSKSLDVEKSSKIWKLNKTNNSETKHITEELNITKNNNEINEIKLPKSRERKTSSRIVLLPPDQEVYPSILGEKYIDDNTIEEAKSVLNEDIKSAALVKEENLWALRMEVNDFKVLYNFYFILIFIKFISLLS
jgi:hypothetical protein